jgi:hypothetical protein
VEFVRVVKVSILAGLAFGIGTCFIVLPVAYFLGGIKGGLYLSAGSGALFGLAIGVLSYTAARRLQSRVDLTEGETLIHQGAASHWKGKQPTGGWLYLTNHRLVFVSHSASRAGQRWETSLNEIRGVSLCTSFKVMPNGIFVSTVFHEDGDGERFVVEHRKRWKQHIDGAIALLPKDKTWAEMYYPQSTRSEIGAADYIQQHGAFPLPDRSHIHRNRSLASGQMDLGWITGSINDGRYERPLWIETWADAGHITNQTYFFSRIGLEDLTASQVLESFRASGLIECEANTPCVLLRINDRRNRPLWSFNLCLSTGETLYVRKTTGYHVYPKAQSAYTHCIVCGADCIEPVAAFDGRGVPHGSPRHNFVHDYHEISLCPQCGNGQLEVHSHDCWSHDERRDMYCWYAIAPDEVQAIREMKTLFCNTPLAADCSCAWHQSLTRRFEQALFTGVTASDGQRAESYRWLTAVDGEAGGVMVVDTVRGLQNVAAAQLPHTNRPP